MDVKVYNYRIRNRGENYEQRFYQNEDNSPIYGGYHY